MTRLTFGLVLVLAAVALGACGSSAPAGRVLARPPAVRAPTVRVAPGQTCLVAAPVCTIHPCVEFIAPAPRKVLPRASQARCELYRRLRARLVFIRR